jgi:hypothetical protein
LRAALLYQNPETIRTTPQAPVNRIRNVDGRINQATMAALADKVPPK